MGEEKGMGEGKGRREREKGRGEGKGRREGEKERGEGKRRGIQVRGKRGKEEGFK